MWPKGCASCDLPACPPFLTTHPWEGVQLKAGWRLCRRSLWLFTPILGL